MERQIPRIAHVLIALSLTVVSCQSNDPATGGSDFDASTEVKGAETTVPGELLLRMLQFEAPYPGHFQELRLYRDGVALTFRNVPNGARQGSHSARLRQDVFNAVQRKLDALDLSEY